MQSTQTRLLSLEDVPALTEIIQAEAVHLGRWEPKRDPGYYTLSNQRTLAKRALEAHEAGDSVPFLIVSDSDEILGRVTVSGITRGAMQSCAIGYWVRQRSLGQGYPTRAVAQAVSFAFKDLGLHRVQAETMLENIGSQRVLEKNGFQQYGIAPQYLNIDGKWRDHLMYQVLNDAYVDEP
ncbi:GNAT family N-acetyltransferase [Leucobacter coleopterorum]|uniref:GNAT family N-acetyltransferase n=2 Tax=Leucobacter coleopterorum TaxID=2714933 RepID=A0ABX6JZZ8_9MICO|nr:GNAT family N-acetyltransferase [Leucobacter coleopterorum]